MGPALNVRSKEIVAGYASIAANVDVDKIHKEQGIEVPVGATVDMCPHASAARNAALKAEELAAAARKKGSGQTLAKGEAQAAAAAGCPYHKAALAESVGSVVKPADHFGYEQFFVNELDKKHQDNSYRYFNNINRLAAKFPVAHTNDVKDEVQVWCSNDYLGMGNNPVVLETMQYVFLIVQL